MFLLIVLTKISKGKTNKNVSVLFTIHDVQYTVPNVNITLLKFKLYTVSSVQLTLYAVTKMYNLRCTL